ncbi:MAG: hypothetical protein AAGB15_11835 [Pseudomonadota bacterium]
MGFDLLIASGTGNAILKPELLGCIVEVRVEQSLDQPTKFAVRFLDDIVSDDDQGGLRKGQLMKPQLPELKIGEVLTIAVNKDEGEYTCLVRGPILETAQETTLGGPGSWYEVKGLDRRDELARNYREGAWAGRASDVATMLLAPVYPAQTIDPTTEMYDQDGKHLSQRSSDLEFLTTNAAENGYHFWISYSGTAEAPGNSLTVLEQANWRASPPLQDSPPGLPLPLPLAEDAVAIRVNVGPDQCSNTTKFSLSRDGARPSQVQTSTVNNTDGQTDPVSVMDQASPLGGSGDGLADQAPARFIPPTPQGDAQTARRINEAALREAGFFVKGELSTTRYLLRDVLQPHQIIAVEGLGQASGNVPFRVAEVTHVVNGMGHFMDAKIETNAEVPL